MAQIVGNPRYNQYSAYEGQTNFSFDFDIVSDDEIKIQNGTTVLTLSVDYRVSILENGGGFIYLNTPTAEGDLITITANTAIARVADFIDGGDFAADVIDAEFNKLDWITEETLSQQQQTLYLNPINPGFDGGLSGIIADRCIKVNSDGDGFIMSERDPDLAQAEAEAYALDAKQFAAQASQSALEAEQFAAQASQSAADASQSAEEAENWANTINLPNLESDISPATTETYSIGTALKRFINLYSQNIYTDNLQATLINGQIPAYNLGFAIMWDEKPLNTPGGQPTVSTWYPRVINTVNYNTISGCSLSVISDPIEKGQITLPAGTYRVRAIAPTYDAGQNMARLYDVTNDVALLLGSSEFSGNTKSIIDGVFTVASTIVMEIQHWVISTVSLSRTFGRESNITTEKYTQLYIEKLV